MGNERSQRLQIEPVEIGKAIVHRKGEDVTVVGVSYMQVECLRAASTVQAA